MTIERLVIALTARSGMSERTLADRIGVPPKTLAAWAAGRKRPDAAQLAALARASRAIVYTAGYGWGWTPEVIDG